MSCNKRLNDDVCEGICDILDILCASHGPLLEPLQILNNDKVSELSMGISDGNTPPSLVEDIDNDSLIWSAILCAMDSCESALTDDQRDVILQVTKREVNQAGLRLIGDNLTPIFIDELSSTRMTYIGSMFACCEILTARSLRSAPAVRKCILRLFNYNPVSLDDDNVTVINSPSDDDVDNIILAGVLSRRMFTSAFTSFHKRARTKPSSNPLKLWQAIMYAESPRALTRSMEFSHLGQSAIKNDTIINNDHDNKKNNNNENTMMLSNTNHSFMDSSIQDKNNILKDDNIIGMRASDDISPLKKYQSSASISTSSINHLSPAPATTEKEYDDDHSNNRHHSSSIHGHNNSTLSEMDSIPMWNSRMVERDGRKRDFSENSSSSPPSQQKINNSNNNINNSGNINRNVYNSDVEDGAYGYGMSMKMGKGGDRDGYINSKSNNISANGSMSMWLDSMDGDETTSSPLPRNKSHHDSNNLSNIMNNTSNCNVYGNDDGTRKISIEELRMIFNKSVLDHIETQENEQLADIGSISKYVSRSIGTGNNTTYDQSDFHICQAIESEWNSKPLGSYITWTKLLTVSKPFLAEDKYFDDNFKAVSNLRDSSPKKEKELNNQNGNGAKLNHAPKNPSVQVIRSASPDRHRQDLSSSQAYNHGDSHNKSSHNKSSHNKFSHKIKVPDPVNTEWGRDSEDWEVARRKLYHDKTSSTTVSKENESDDTFDVDIFDHTSTNNKPPKAIIRKSVKTKEVKPKTKVADDEVVGTKPKTPVSEQEAELGQEPKQEKEEEEVVVVVKASPRSLKKSKKKDQNLPSFALTALEESGELNLSLSNQENYDKKLSEFMNFVDSQHESIPAVSPQQSRIHSKQLNQSPTSPQNHNSLVKDTNPSPQKPDSIASSPSISDRASSSPNKFDTFDDAPNVGGCKRLSLRGLVSKLGRYFDRGGSGPQSKGKEKSKVFEPVFRPESTANISNATTTTSSIVNTEVDIDDKVCSGLGLANFVYSQLQRTNVNPKTQRADAQSSIGIYNEKQSASGAQERIAERRRAVERRIRKSFKPPPWVMVVNNSDNSNSKYNVEGNRQEWDNLVASSPWVRAIQELNSNKGKDIDDYQNENEEQNETNTSKDANSNKSYIFRSAIHRNKNNNPIPVSSSSSSLFDKHALFETCANVIKCGFVEKQDGLSGWTKRYLVLRNDRKDSEYNSINHGTFTLSFFTDVSQSLWGLLPVTLKKSFPLKNFSKISVDSTPSKAGRELCLTSIDAPGTTVTKLNLKFKDAADTAAWCEALKKANE